MKKGLLNRFLFLLVALFFLNSCVKEESPPQVAPQQTDLLQDVSLTFEFLVDDNPLETNGTEYTNLANNQYKIDSLKLLIGRIEVIDVYDNKQIIKDYHLIDVNDSASLNTPVYRFKNLSTIQTLRVCMGLDANDHQNYDKLNHNMKYPDHIKTASAGGYYAFKIDGTFDTKDSIAPFNIHIGNQYLLEKVEKMENFEICKILNSAKFKLLEGRNTIVVKIHVNDIFGNPSKSIPAFDLDSMSNNLEFDGRATRQIGYNLTEGMNFYSVTYN